MLLKKPESAQSESETVREKMPSILRQDQDPQKMETDLETKTDLKCYNTSCGEV